MPGDDDGGTDGEATPRTGGSRRKFLTRAAVGGGLVWAAPTVLSSTASAGPGTPPCTSCGQLIAGGTGTPTDLASWTITGTPVSLNNQFRGGAGGASVADTLTQVINLVGQCNGTPAVLSASLRSSQNSSISTVTATWFNDPNATGTIVGTTTITSTSTTFTTFTTNTTVPNGAQSVQVVVSLFQGGNSQNSGGADNITLTLC